MPPAYPPASSEVFQRAEGREIKLWAEIKTSSSGLAADPQEFERLLSYAHYQTKVKEIDLIRDYFLTKCLKHIVDRIENENCIVFSGDPNRKKSVLRPLARLAFAGGTSLVSAWDVTQRYSEDLDLMALIVDPEATQTARKRPMRVISRWAAEALEAQKHEQRTINFKDAEHRRTLFNLGGYKEFLKLETSVEADENGIWALRSVLSIMGRFATQEQLTAYPELGGFTMPAISPGYTAANKFDALHRRAETGKYNGLRKRVRDLYDLAMIALSVYADQVREDVPRFADRAADFLGHRDIVFRPEDGYANSAMFYRGTEAYHALEDAYQKTMSGMVWGNMPSFEEAISLAASLDGG